MTIIEIKASIFDIEREQEKHQDYIMKWQEVKKQKYAELNQAIEREQLEKEQESQKVATIDPTVIATENVNIALYNETNTGIGELKTAPVELHVTEEQNAKAD